jgi:hypothetical protein
MKHHIIYCSFKNLTLSYDDLITIKNIFDIYFENIKISIQNSHYQNYMIDCVILFKTKIL